MLMIQRLLYALLIAFTLTIAQASIAADKKAKPFIPEPVSSKQSIRFYKANKQLQADRVMITADKASKSGCNNFLKKVRVFKTLQIGFQSCYLYEKKNCDVGSLVPVNSEKQERHTYILSEGKAWFAQDDDERGADVRSWSCRADIEEGELRAETLIASQESTRLTQARSLANQKLIKAQANFDQAEKSVKESLQYNKFVRKEAIAAGIIEVEEDPEDNADRKEVIEESEENGTD